MSNLVAVLVIVHVIALRHSAGSLGRMSLAFTRRSWHVLVIVIVHVIDLHHSAGSLGRMSLTFTPHDHVHAAFLARDRDRDRDRPRDRSASLRWFARTHVVDVHAAFTRASLSISLNIAESAGRATVAEKAHFFAIARGSAMKCAAIVDVLLSSGIAGIGPCREARALLIRIVQMLTKLEAACRIRAE